MAKRFSWFCSFSVKLGILMDVINIVYKMVSDAGPYKV